MAVASLDTGFTKESIINNALSFLNGAKVKDSDIDFSPVGEVMKSNWPISVREVLSSATWDFATTRVKLVHLADEEQFEKDNQLYMLPYCFSLPDGYIDTVELFDAKNHKPIMISPGDFYVTDSAYLPPVNRPSFLFRENMIRSRIPEIIMEYVKFIEEPTTFSIEFVQCLRFHLAMVGTQAIINSANYEMQMKSHYDEALMKAKARMASKDLPRVVY
jgi:hypothetical protein